MRRLTLPGPPWWLTLPVVAVVCVLIGMRAWGLYTANNDFPERYHPDEPSKADQVLDGTRNLRHPLMLLETTRLAAERTGLNLPQPPRAQVMESPGGKIDWRWVKYLEVLNDRARRFEVAPMPSPPTEPMRDSSGKIDPGWSQYQNDLNDWSRRMAMPAPPAGRVEDMPNRFQQNLGTLRRTLHDKMAQPMAELGRKVSAAFGVTAVVALALTAYFLRGLIAGVAVGLVSAYGHSLLIYSHYFKEDAGLVMGLAVAALGVAMVYRTRATAGVIVAAAGCAAAVSGKYVGVAALLMVLPLIALAPRRLTGLAAKSGEERSAFHVFHDARVFFTLAMGAVAWVLWVFDVTWLASPLAVVTVIVWLLPRWLLPVDAVWRVAVLLIWTIVLAALVNARLFSDWGMFERNFLDYELTHPITEHSGMTAKFPNWYWWDALRAQVTWPAWVFAVAYLALVLGTIWKRSIAEIGLALWAIVWFVVVLFSVVPFNRYMLPAEVFLYFMAGMGVAETARAAVWLTGWIIGKVRGKKPILYPPGDKRAIWGEIGRPWLRWTAHAAVAAALILPLMIVQTARCRNYLDQLAHDSRSRLDDWIVEQLNRDALLVAEGKADQVKFPDGSVILADSYGVMEQGRLWSNDKTRSVEVVTVYSMRMGFLTSAGDLQAMRRGLNRPGDPRRTTRITHVATSDLTYDRYFNPHLHALDDAAKIRLMSERPLTDKEVKDRINYYAEASKKAKKLYEDLFACELLWESRPSPPTGSYTNPTVRLYSIVPGK